MTSALQCFEAFTISITTGLHHAPSITHIKNDEPLGIGSPASCPLLLTCRSYAWELWLPRLSLSGSSGDPPEASPVACAPWRRENLHINTFLDGENRKTLGKFKKIIIINLQGINYLIHCHFTNLSLNVFEEDSDSLYFPTIEMVWLSEVTIMLPRRQMPSVIPGRPGLAFGPLMNGTNALPEYPWSFDGIWTWIGACRQAKMRVKGKDLNQTWTGCQVRKSYSGWLLVPFE